jgi:hypothetical protein
MKRRLLVLALVVGLGALLLAAGASAAEPSWHSEQPVAAGIGVPAPLGEIGEIAFWTPDRGVLITAGNQGMPAGVYAYDGVGWYLYSTVCGGPEGRIAWAGPDEFWTVSDYASKQEGALFGSEEYARTLCRFANGQVVASYAEPLGSTETYEKMRAAVCDAPVDCWFAGEPLPRTAPNSGAFHLRWDGSSLTAIPSLTVPQPQLAEPPGGVTGLASYSGSLFESAEEAPFLRQIVAGATEPFQPLTLPAGVGGPFELSSDGGQLWAVGENGSSALRFGASGFEKVPLKAGVGQIVALAAEPGSEGAWVGGAGESAATVTHLEADGSVGTPIALPRPSEELDSKGRVTTLACPAPGQCWLGTRKGWLFHLGGPLPQDTDPAMHVLISLRPADNSTRSFVPAGVPEDDSGETEPSRGAELPLRERFPHPVRHPALVVKIHQRVIGRSVLELSFVLRARAHVRLIAEWHGKAVAHTSRLTLGKGPHSIRLRLDPKRWPTGLDFQVHPAARRSKR